MSISCVPLPSISRAVASLAVLLCSTLSFAQTLSLTFDDGLNPDKQPHAQVWNQQIITSLKGADITAMIFPSLVRIGGDRGMALVMDWAEAGHTVGNHTATHPNFAATEMTLDDFIADVKMAHIALHHFPTWVPMLRFPYLKEGDTLEKRDGFRTWMQENGYKPAPVSIDASDWYYNQIYSKFLEAGSNGRASKVKAAYIEHLTDRASYYDELAKRVLGRSPSHVMLLHTNAINAAALPEIISTFQKLGWKFVSPVIAFEDPIYASQPETLPAGESVIWASAKSRGISGLRYPAEDSVYEEPKLRSKSLLPR